MCEAYLELRDEPEDGELGPGKIHPRHIRKHCRDVVGWGYSGPLANFFTRCIREVHEHRMSVMLDKDGQEGDDTQNGDDPSIQIPPAEDASGLF